MEEKKIKTREGAGYLKQLYSFARNTAGTTHNSFKDRTTILVNFIPVDKVDPSEHQVRVHFDPQEISALAESIKQHGVLQPILVVQNGERYKVIAGERRLRATKVANLDRIPARIIRTDDKAEHEIALRENLDRVDLHPIEEGEAYLSLLEARAFTSHEGIAKAFGKPKSRITEAMGYTKLPEVTKQELMRCNIKARAVLRKLMQSPPGSHMKLIAKHVKTEKEREALNAAQAAARSMGTTKPKEKLSEFQFQMSDKGVSVPNFRWKIGEGPERLRDYLAKMRQFIEEAQSKFT